MTREGVNIVGDDFMLATAADIVADPSAPDALLKVSWKVKIGYGMVAFFVRSLLRKHTKINTLVDPATT